MAYTLRSRLLHEEDAGYYDQNYWTHLNLRHDCSETFNS